MKVQKKVVSCCKLMVLAAIAILLVSPSAHAEFTDCELCPTMVEIPTGEVLIGSKDGDAYRRKGYERDQVLAKIRKPFAMATTEVTLGQYRSFVAATNHKAEPLIRDGKELAGCNYFDGAGYGYIARHNWQNPGYPQREDAPVVCVSWSDANQYAAWLSEMTGRKYRVPSTVEFEYAMRAGSDTPWFWGSDPGQACEFANIGDKTFGHKYPDREQFACTDRYVYTAPVAKFSANGFGLFDMVGNAWEWTNDCWHADFEGSPLDGSSWLDANDGDCDFRVPKGGSWISGPKWARASVRSKDGAHYRSFMLGFRVAADIDTQN